ncbi:Ku DNA-binding complex, Ku70 subunit [Piedraia hortae CBS 480.64]|uniref:ATP-dependent DNA helicase II subunit 1 n=1 Tax=Piedraia hortae CBS 480.64 TaxID=1314780 RepID=A0A6A7C630_9PEZI|nr:Ku DNA-binding complex, Ku70 subunit [Piedraia hortae CBS 480.64]
MDPDFDPIHENDEELGEDDYKVVKDAVLFAIDVSQSMLAVPDGADTSSALAALKCAYHLMQQRILSSPNDRMGVMLFGTEESKFQDDEESGQMGPFYPHCYLLLDLDVPLAADVKKLRDLVDDEDEASKLLVSSEEEVSMANVLFCANQIFASRATNFASRRLFIVTDNDSPHAGNKYARNSAAVRAKDLYDLGVTIDLFPISHPNRSPPYYFDRTKFYDDIVYSLTPSDPDAPMPVLEDVKPVSSTTKDGITLLQSLISSVISRSTPQRALFNDLPFEIAPGLKISIKGFNIFKRQEPKRTSYVYLPPDGSNPQIATGTSRLVSDDDPTKTIDKAEIRKGYKFGGESIPFTLEEISKIKSFGEPVLRVIGFKPLAAIPVWANITSSTYIYPSETSYVGSTRVFSALYQKLLKDDKVGLAWYIARRNATPRLVAILPSREMKDKEMTIPEGLYLKPLPYADDIRQAPDLGVMKIRTTDPLTDATRGVVQQLHLPGGTYSPWRYPNPSLQHFYRILQALALDEDLPDKLDDKTTPRFRQIHARTGKLVHQWTRMLDKEFASWQESQSSASGGGGGGGGGGAKRQRLDTLSDAQMKSAYDSGRLYTFTVQKLRSWAITKNLCVSGLKKAEIVDAIQDWFDNTGA